MSKRESTRSLRRITSYTPGEIVIGKWVRIRFYIVGAIMSLCLCGVAYKAYGLQVSKQSHFQALAERQHNRTIETPAPRGNIYDRHGAELAVNAGVDSVFGNPRRILDVALTSQKLAEVLRVNVRSLEQRLASGRHFTWIKRHVTPTEAAKVRALDLPGIKLLQEPRRYYPGKSVAGHILGFAGIDGNGLDGLELTMNEILTGKQAKISALRDASGKMVVASIPELATPGAAIGLTIDRTIQFAAERAIESAVREHKAKSAVAVVVDVKSGDVLALASYPNFDPNRPNHKAKGARNRGITDAYEIGSVMKVFAIASALEAGVVAPSTMIDTEQGRYRVGRKVFRDSFHDDELKIGDILKRSSNVGSIKVAQKLGADSLRAGLVRFGFGQSTDIELPGETSGVLHPAERWGPSGLATHSFGLGMTVTPLQLTAAMAAIGNDGVYFEPRVIREVVDGTGELLYRRVPKGHRVVSKQTANQVIPMLESVFAGGKQHGTAHQIYVPGHKTGGKTGTAHKYDPETKSYSEDTYLSSFAGLAPSNDPRIAVTVLIDEPSLGLYHGAEVAGPAWVQLVTEAMASLSVPANPTVLATQRKAQRRIARRAAWRLGLNPDKIEQVRRRNEIPLHQEEPTGEQAPTELIDLNQEVAQETIRQGDPGVILVPDFTGMGMAKSLALARSRGLRVVVRGTGRAIDQSLAPGLVRTPDVIEITFTASEQAFASK